MYMLDVTSACCCNGYCAPKIDDAEGSAWCGPRNSVGDDEAEKALDEYDDVQPELVAIIERRHEDSPQYGASDGGDQAPDHAIAGVHAEA